MKVRTRFAPSPTGDLHLGGARTALFAWLLARHYDGKFLIRIEDTDPRREKIQALPGILESLDWLGLKSDEPVIFQSQRGARYQYHLDHLLASGLAYRCECTHERLEALRNEQMAQKVKPKYDGRCRELGHCATTKTRYVIRFKTPTEGTIRFHDQIRGALLFQNKELDDLVIWRPDAGPTYNFCVVVDDWEMDITHVIRGEDHVNNTPRQMHIAAALGAPCPVYAHVPIIHNEQGQKLSKRTDAAGLLTYRTAGFLPDALVNYLVRLGWAHGDQEIFSRQELVQYFDLDRVRSSPSALNYSKLLWINKKYLQSTDLSDLTFCFKSYLKDHRMDKFQALDQKGIQWEEAVALFRSRSQTLAQLEEAMTACWHRSDSACSSEALGLAQAEGCLQALTTIIADLEDLVALKVSSVDRIIRSAVSPQVPLATLGSLLRYALFGKNVAPRLDAVICFLGRTEVLARLKLFIQKTTPFGSPSAPGRLY